MRSAEHASALIVAVLLIGLLATLTMTAVQFYLSLGDSHRQTTAGSRAGYLAELARADAVAYVKAHPAASWPYTRPLTAVADDAGKNAGEYTYTIIDLTVPGGDPRRRIEATAYWPSQADVISQQRVYVWMKETAGAWQITAWTTRDYTVDI